MSDERPRAAQEPGAETNDQAGPGPEKPQPWVFRAVRVGGGGLLVVAGIVMLVTPGPGLVALAAGLGLLSTEFDEAAAVLNWLRQRIPGIPDEGPIPTRVWVVATVTMLAAIGAAIYVGTILNVL